MKKRQDNRQVKMLVSIINKADQKTLTETLNQYTVAMHFSGIGHGTARSHYRSYFGIDDVEKRVTFSLIPNYLERTLLNAVGKKLKLYMSGNGIAFTVPLSTISSIIEEPILSISDKEMAKIAKSTAGRCFFFAVDTAVSTATVTRKRSPDSPPGP